MKACLSMLCLLSACSGLTQPPPPPPPPPSPGPTGCREGTTPTTCTGGPIGFGGPQGTFLEGPNLERLRFTARLAPGVFPPPALTKLDAAIACGPAVTVPQIVVQDCTLQSEGAALCHVDSGIINICSVNNLESNRSRRVLVVRGFWDPTGAWIDAPDVVTLACNALPNDPAQSSLLNGAIAKCAHFDPATRRDAFLACIRMQRADYCGDGHPHTVNGTDIYAHDLTDPMTPAECHDGRCFEASWSKDGAVCFARPRWVGVGMGHDLCSDKFTPSDAPGIVCRGPSASAVLFSRSALHECTKPGSKPCRADADEACQP